MFLHLRGIQSMGNFSWRPEVEASDRRHRTHLPQIHLPHLPQHHVPALRASYWKPSHLKLHTLDSFQSRNYSLLWGATAASSAAFWSQQVVIGWLTYNLTHSPFLTGVVLGLDALPILLVGPLGGMLVDSWTRRRLLVIIYGYQSALTLGFSVLVLIELASVLSIFLYTVLMGLGWVLTDPARMSLIPSLVPRQNLLNAFALNSLAFSVTRLAAPALVGTVLAVSGPAYGLAIEAALLLVALGLASNLRLETAVRPPLRMLSALPRLLEGVRYVRSHRSVLGLICAAAVPSVLGMPFVHGLMPVYAAEVFHRGPVGLGLLMAAIGAGATAGTVLLASFGGAGRRGMLGFCSLLMVAGILVFSQNSWFLPALANLMLLSAGMMVFFAVCNATIQSQVPDELRGRVAGLYMLNWGLSPLGSLAAGVLAQHIGAPGATLWAGAVMAALFLVFAGIFSSVWQKREETQVVNQTAQERVVAD
jgi:MFS family permease